MAAGRLQCQPWLHFLLSPDSSSLSSFPFSSCSSILQLSMAICVFLHVTDLIGQCVCLSHAGNTEAKKKSKEKKRKPFLCFFSSLLYATANVITLQCRILFTQFLSTYYCFCHTALFFLSCPVPSAIGLSATFHSLLLFPFLSLPPFSKPLHVSTLFHNVGLLINTTLHRGKCFFDRPFFHWHAQ